MRKALKYFLWVIALLILLLLMAGGAAVYWAYTGPRDLSQYTADIEKSINSALKNNRVKIGGASLAYGGFERPLFIDAKNVVIFNNTTNATVARMDDMQLSFGVVRLLTGNYIPSRLSLVGAYADTAEFGKSDSDQLDLRDFNLSGLRRLELKNSTIRIAELDETWKIDTVRLKFRRGKASIDGTLRPSNSEVITLSGKGDYNKGDYNVAAKVSNLDILRFGKMEPELLGANLKVNGNIIARLSDFKLNVISADLDSVIGTVEHPKLRSKLGIHKANIAGSYNLLTKDAELEKSHFQFDDGFIVDAEGSMSGKHDIKLAARAGNIKIENVHKYWPVDVGNNAITWMDAHLKNGVMTNAVATINISGADYDAGTVPANAVDFKYDITGMDVNYVDGLLPVMNANGKAHMNVGSLFISMTSGKLGTSTLGATKVNITGIGGDAPEQLVINGVMSGDIRDIADYYIKVNNKRGRKTLFKTTQDISGKADSKVVVKLPLIDGMTFEQVGFDINSKIANGSIKSDKLSARNAALELHVNNEGFNVKGTATASVNSPDYKFTDVPVILDYTDMSGKLRAAVDADITNSEIKITQLGVTKPKAIKGRVELMLDGTNLSKFVIDSVPLKLVASGALTPAQDDIQKLTITNFEGNGTKLSATVENNKGYNVTLKATTFNAIPILESMDAKGKDKSADSTNINIKGDIAKMLFYQDQSLENVKLNISCAADCNNIDLDSADLVIKQTPTKLNITSDNAGKILKMLDAFENMDNGKMTVNADGDGKGAYTGKVVITEFVIQKFPALAKILTIGSLTGMAESLQGSGISFKRLRTKFTRDDNEVKIMDFKMFGASIGVTTDGTYDRVNDKLDFGGKIIPAYTANTLLGHIPILGDIIIGDEGVFAFAYTVKGKMEDPDVFVNPLSVLAPGILQDIFQ